MLAEFDWRLIFGTPNIAIIMTMLIPITGVIVGTWAGVARSRSLDDLKRELVERGMSADEIERIIRAKPEKSRRRSAE